jgi:cell division protease FtsH
MPEERQITTRAQLLDEMCAALGGRAAEEVIFGEVSTGALSDLEKVTKQAYAMVSIYGLDEALGHISYYDSTGQSEYNFQKPYSEKTAELIDKEVKKIIDEAYFRAKEILSNNKDKLIQLAEKLLEKEVIFKEDLEEIFGKRPWDKEHVIDMENTDNKSNESQIAEKSAESSEESDKQPENTVEENKETVNKEQTTGGETEAAQKTNPGESEQKQT